MSECRVGKVGLALGAGAARGLAHIGVIQALQEHHIPIDLISGCSMGAVIGALYVTGSNLNFFQRLIPEMEMYKYIDYKISKHGIVRGERTKDLIKLLTKNKTFEETSIPFTCIAIDLQNGQKIVFSSGYIYDAVRASISIPGIFVPYEHNGRMYIDGGMIERTPVDTVRKMGADFVIACDVSYRGEEITRPKSTVSTITQVINFMGWEIAKHQIFAADVLLMPNVYDINPYSNVDSDKCIEIGYKTTIAAIPEIKEKIFR